MYSTRWTWPAAVRLCRSYFMLHTGQIFLTIHGAGFAGGQVAVAAVLEVHADLIGV